MPSRLLNLRHQLRWRDFQGQVPPNSEFSAETDTKMRLRYGHASSGGQTRLTDNVVVTVQLRRAHSWAKAGAVRTAALLNHEQRHYDITALMSRDFFIDMMQLKTRTFPSTGTWIKKSADWPRTMPRSRYMISMTMKPTMGSALRISGVGIV